MPVFFSGTDIEELAENSAAHDYYLSLITNNRGEFCAKVAHRGRLETRGRTKYWAKGNGNAEVQIGGTDLDTDAEAVLVHRCDIECPRPYVPPVDEGFEKAVADIITESESPVDRSGGAFAEKAQIGKADDSAWAVSVRTEDMLADLFANASGMGEYSLAGQYLSPATAVQLAAEVNGPEETVRYVVENYKKFFRRHFGDEHGLARVTAEAVFQLEAHEEEYPAFLPEIIDNLAKMANERHSGKTAGETDREAEARELKSLFPAVDDHGCPVPARTEKPDFDRFALDVFRNALKALCKSPSNLPGYHETLEKAVDDLAKAAKNAPGRAVEALVQAFDDNFGEYCGPNASDRDYNDALFHFLFSLEAYESDYPGFLSDAITRLVEKGRP